MNGSDEITRRLAAEFGPDVTAELKSTIEDGDELSRTMGINEAAAAASFAWAVVQAFLDVRAKRRDEAGLLADLAAGLEVDPRLAAHFAPEKRLGLAARVLDKLLPASFGRPTPEQIAAGNAERALWVENFIATRQRETGLATRTWTDVKTRNFIGGATILMPFAEQDHWIVYKEIGWIPDDSDGRGLVQVDVPRGFVTDLASVPWYLWSALNKTGLYGNAAIYHDWLYWRQSSSRLVADTVFERAMKDMGVGALTRNIFYLAVRTRGGGYWDENTAAKSRGEKRVLKNFPDSPKITWEQWRQDPNNFYDNGGDDPTF